MTAEIIDMRVLTPAEKKRLADEWNSHYRQPSIPRLSPGVSIGELLASRIYPRMPEPWRSKAKGKEIVEIEGIDQDIKKLKARRREIVRAIRRRRP